MSIRRLRHVLVAVAGLISLLGVASSAVRDLRRRQGHLWTLIPDQRGATRSVLPVTASDRSLRTPRTLIVRWAVSGVVVIGLAMVIWVLGVEVVGVLVGAIGVTLLGMGKERGSRIGACHRSDPGRVHASTGTRRTAPAPSPWSLGDTDGRPGSSRRARRVALFRLDPACKLCRSILGMWVSSGVARRWRRRISQ